MRIYLPLTAEDREALESAARELELAAGRPAWGVSTEARTERSEQDEEDLEYDALQDAVHIAFSLGGGDSRALVIAADAPDEALAGEQESGGAFGVVTRQATRARIASFHVSELDAESADQDDTDPALLWFDASEGTDALAYLDGVGQD